MPGLLPNFTTPVAFPRVWAFLPGFREWFLVALVVVAVYGRLAVARPARWLIPRQRPLRRANPRLPGLAAWVVERWVLVFMLLAGAVVLAWATTSALVARSSVTP